MEDPTFAKYACEQCEGHIEAPTEAAGMTVECPHCRAQTTLNTGVNPVKKGLSLVGAAKEPAATGADAPPPLSSFSSAPPTRSEPHPDSYQFEFINRPDFGFANVQLAADQTIKVEASAMATMDTNVRMKTKFKGGLGRFLTGESLFINEFTAENGPGEIGIAPGAPGDIEHVYLENETIFLQNSGYVASHPSVGIETKWQGLMKGFFGGDGLFLIKCSGVGDLFFSTYGAMIPIEVDGEYVVDNSYMVAFTEGLDYTIEKVGGYKSLFFSGEGLVCRYRGQGRIWLQTRQVPSFASWIYPYRRAKRGN